MGGGDVHALDLGDLGVEVADAADRRRLAVDPGQQHHAARRDQVGWRPGGDLGLDVDLGAERPVGLADEGVVEGEHLGSSRAIDRGCELHSPSR